MAKRASVKQKLRGRANLRKGSMSRVGSRGNNAKPRMPRSPSITR